MSSRRWSGERRERRDRDRQNDDADDNEAISRGTEPEVAADPDEEQHRREIHGGAHVVVGVATVLGAFSVLLVGSGVKSSGTRGFGLLVLPHICRTRRRV